MGGWALVALGPGNSWLPVACLLACPPRLLFLAMTPPPSCLPAWCTHARDRRHDRFWRGAGVAAPVFSLRTHNSVGVGEFLDLIPLVDLADRCARQDGMPGTLACIHYNHTMVANRVSWAACNVM